MEASGTENSAKQFQLATNEAQDAPEKGGKEILTYQSSWMIVFLSEYLYTKESIRSRNARSEEVIVFMRFPHLAKQIFEKLNNKSLMKCRQINEFWKMAVDYEKIISIRKKTVLIRKISNKVRLSTYATEKALQKQDLNTLIAVANYCSVSIPDYPYPLTVLGHITRWYGDYSNDKTIVEILCQLIIENCEDKKRLHRNLDRLFVEKASWGQAIACQFLMKYLLNGNPYDVGVRYTALHIAARNGHLKVVQLILKHEKRPWMLNSKSENPEYFGRTPLDEAKVSLKNNERRFMRPSLKTKQEIHDLIQSAINKMDEPPITTG